MITVKCSEDQFAYDIHSLVKAFYPAEDVKVFLEGEKDISSDRDLPELFILLGKQKIEITLQVNQNTILTRYAELRGKEERAEYKNVLKQLLYRTLSAHTGKELPWGTLTGIRPTKIPYMMMEEGKTNEEIRTYMRETYFCSDEKAELAYEIAAKERQILSKIHYEDGYSLYLGIPFCPTTCLYCSFTSYPICAFKDKVGHYLTALKKEIDYVKEAFQNKILDSVYIGGGTPTTLEAEQLKELLSYLRQNLDFSQVKEFTVEAGRADSITKEKLEVLKAQGVTRISVNPQTMNQKTLDLIGRRHTVEQVNQAFYLARETGFTNINMDLILGLPNETKEDVAITLQEVEKLHPDSLTVHSLAIKRASKLSQWILEHGISCLKNTDETMQDAAKTAKKMDMQPYYLYRQKNMSGNFENVGYATPGNYGIYNILIMEEVQTIIACGAGTVTKRVYPDGRIERCDNVKDVALYISKIEEMIDRKRQLFAD
ncbi:MAG: coproporphyrinogen dehydrogenase HemZ [Lachnospiraceae bacterium]|nr:coproporphyrinogen dehydrogenase HemZ [Lachnospiraceae bacterium]